MSDFSYLNPLKWFNGLKNVVLAYQERKKRFSGFTLTFGFLLLILLASQFTDRLPDDTKSIILTLILLSFVLSIIFNLQFRTEPSSVMQNFSNKDEIKGYTETINSQKDEIERLQKDSATGSVDWGKFKQIWKPNVAEYQADKTRIFDYYQQSGKKNILLWENRNKDKQKKGDSRYTGVLRIKYLVKAGFDLSKITVDRKTITNPVEIICSLPVVKAQGVSKFMPEWLIRSELTLTKTEGFWNENDVWEWVNPNLGSIGGDFWEKRYNEEVIKITHSESVHPNLSLVIEKLAKDYISDLIQVIDGKKVNFVPDKKISSPIILSDYLTLQSSAKLLSN